MHMQYYNVRIAISNIIIVLQQYILQYIVASSVFDKVLYGTSNDAGRCSVAQCYVNTHLGHVGTK